MTEKRPVATHFLYPNVIQSYTWKEQRYKIDYESVCVGETETVR